MYVLLTAKLVLKKTQQLIEADEFKNLKNKQIKIS